MNLSEHRERRAQLANKLETFMTQLRECPADFRDGSPKELLDLLYAVRELDIEPAAVEQYLALANGRGLTIAKLARELRAAAKPLADGLEAILKAVRDA